MIDSFKGKAWVFGHNVDTDQIIPAKYLVTMNNAELAKHVFEDARPQFAKMVRRGDVVVAGRNFGCGSSREHAPRALIGAGISCVVAESFARIFFRNAINIGLPVIEASISASDGDTIVADVKKGSLGNLTTGNRTVFARYPPFVMMLIEKGGLVPYTKEVLGCRE
jgi:3-isopropylmalate dehydratase small subunit